MTLSLLAALVVGAGAGGLAGWGLARRGRTGGDEVSSAEFLLPEPISGASRARMSDALLAAFRSDDLPEPQDGRTADHEVTARALFAIAAQHQAESAILWRVAPNESRPHAVATSADAAPEDAALADAAEERAAGLPPLDAKALELVRWSATARMVGFDATTRLAVAPVPLAAGDGALTLHFPASVGFDQETLRRWLTRHAEALETWQEVLRTRDEVARQNFRLRRFVRTAVSLQRSRDPELLTQTLADEACAIAAAEWSQVIRWDRLARQGTVRASSRGAPVITRSGTVPADSLLGEVCLDGQPKVYQDARTLAEPGVEVAGGGALASGIGSLVMVPLRRDEQEPVIGALVLGHRQVGGLRLLEARHARDLAVIAAGTLETAWTLRDAQEKARTDQLTGLGNRRYFEEHWARTVGDADRQGTVAGLILIDVDHFKAVNDTYGHEAGDLVLVAVAEALQAGRRASDFAARLGGEELALILAQSDATGAREVAERLRRRIEDLRIRTPAGEVRVTASLGVGIYPGRSGDAARVFDRADRALYAAKRGGRNRVEMAGEPMPVAALP